MSCLANLYELSKEYNDLIELTESGADSEEELLKILESLDLIDSKIEEKVENGIAVIRSLQTLADAINVEITRLQDRHKACANRIKIIKQWYIQNLEFQGRKKVDTKLGSMTVRNNPPSLNIDRASDIPAEFKFEVPAHFELDKSKIKDALKNGVSVPGCNLVFSKGLMIK